VEHLLDRGRLILAGKRAVMIDELHLVAREGLRQVILQFDQDNAVSLCQGGS
jgi:hypothetical protein